MSQENLVLLLQNRTDISPVCSQQPVTLLSKTYSYPSFNKPMASSQQIRTASCLHQCSKSWCYGKTLFYRFRTEVCSPVCSEQSVTLSKTFSYPQFQKQTNGKFSSKYVLQAACVSALKADVTGRPCSVASEQTPISHPFALNSP